MLKRVETGYLGETTRIVTDVYDDEELYALIDLFDDANLYQTPAYCREGKAGANLSHLVLFEKDIPIGVALVRIRKLPPTKTGFAHVYWGPLWRLRNCEEDIEHLGLVLNALKQEYVNKRGLLLRIESNLIEDGDVERYSKVFAKQGFHTVHSARYNTFVLDLDKDLDQLRKNLRGNWRGHLSKAERNGLKTISGSETTLFNNFCSLYFALLKRKKFDDVQDAEMCSRVQEALPNRFKMRISQCEHQGEIAASVVCSTIGNSAVYLLGATSEKGMKTRGSYLLQWEMLKWLKEKGTRYYDLGGIDPEGNPGVYHFKEGFRGRKVTSLGRYECAPGRMRQFLLKNVENVYNQVKR